MKKQLDVTNDQQGDIFYNIEYSGFDLSGNRYILKSKEARNSKSESDVVNMKFVEAKFYLKNFGWSIKEQESGEWRRVVPSPMPQYIMHGKSIKALVNNLSTNTISVFTPFF